MKQTKFRKFCCLVLSLIIAANIANCLSLTSYAAEGVDVVEDTEIRESYTNTKALEEIVDLDEFEEYLATGVYNCDEYIDVSHFNVPYNAESKALVSHFLYKEMTRNFHFNSLSYYYSGGILTKIKPVYTYTFSEYKSMMSEIEESADKLLEDIKGNTYLSEFEKALLIHDRLALLCEYDYTGTTNRYDIYGALVNGKAVCEGYAQAYDFLLEMVGIESYYCSSELLNHAWNIIFIDGVPYHVDVTWDDYAWASGEHGVIGRIEHDNFLRSSDGIYATGHDETDYETFPDDTRYDNHPIQNSKTAVQLIDNEIYYVDNSSEQLKRLSDDTVLCSVEDNWYAPTGGIWSSNYACLSSGNGELFYSLCDTVYKYNLSTQTSTAIFEPTLEQYFSIYGFEYKDGYLVCQINNGPPYSSYGITNLYTTQKLYGTQKPTVSISCTNNVASYQTVTLNMNDNQGIAGYYWGTSSTYSNNTFTSTSSKQVSKQISSSGTYYLTVKNTSGNLSQTQSITFYKTTLNGNGATVSPSYVITRSGNSFSFPTVSKSGYIYKGWSTSSTATSGQTSLTPTKNTTYYAVFEKEPVTISSIEISSLPTKTTYYKGDSFNTSGLKLYVNYSDGSSEIISSGFSTSGFSSSTTGTKTITVSYQGYSDTFTVTVKSPSITLSSSAKTLYVGNTTSLTATVVPSGQSVIWTSSNTSVATVSGGTITAKAAGTATITAKFTYNGTTYSKTCTVTVNNVPETTTQPDWDYDETTSPVLTTEVITTSPSIKPTETTTSRTPESLTVTTKPTKTTYELGESLSTSGLKLKLTYSDGSTQTITSGFTVSGFSSSTTGTKTVIVRYSNLSTSFTVQVTHTHSYSSTTLTDPTCTATGTGKLTCSCGHSYTTSISALGHDWRTRNCGKYCTRCDEITSDSTTGHNYIPVHTKYPTCEESGYFSYICIECGFEYEKTSPAHGHRYNYYGEVSANCTEEGYTIYDCQDCGNRKFEPIPKNNVHSYQNTTTPATLSANGKTEKICTLCNKIASTTVIYSPKTIKLSTATCTYNGKVRTPSVTVKDSNGNVLVNGTDYKVSVPSGRKLPGIYKYTITFMGKYSGTKTLDFTILPKAPTTISATQTTSTITLNWSESAGATGYRVYQYSPSQGKYVQVASVKGVTSYTKTTNFKAGTEYSFKVKPYTKLSDGTVLWGVASEAFLTATKCSAPTITSVTSPSKSKATVKWSNVGGETGYQLYYATSKDGTYKKINSYGADVLTGTKTFSDSASGKTIYFKVRAYHKVNGQTIFSSWSAIKSAKLK